MALVNTGPGMMHGFTAPLVGEWNALHGSLCAALPPQGSNCGGRYRVGARVLRRSKCCCATRLGDRANRSARRGGDGRQAQLIAQWMLLDFVHWVINTDNTSISGETIYYGPFAFMETDAYHAAESTASSSSSVSGSGLACMLLVRAAFSPTAGRSAGAIPQARVRDVAF